MIEAWSRYPNIDSYYRIIDDSIYMNHIYIRNDILRNRTIDTIEYGFRIDDINFRYLPPKTKKILLGANEIGDFNFLSNKWIKNIEFTKENRLGKTGGMGFKLNKLIKKYAFIDCVSDHDCIYIELNEPIRKYLLADKNKVVNAMDDIFKRGSNEFKYIYKFRKNLKYRRNKDIINPNKFDMEAWYNIYGNVINKYKKGNYITTLGNNRELTQSIGTNCYDVNNRPTKMITQYLYKNEIKNENLEKFIKILSKDEKFNARIICINKKKNTIPNSINDIRPISILPISMKISEHTRVKLRDKLIACTDKRIFSFLPGQSTHNAINDIFDHILEYD